MDKVYVCWLVLAACARSAALQPGREQRDITFTPLFATRELRASRWSRFQPPWRRVAEQYYLYGAQARGVRSLEPVEPVEEDRLSRGARSVAAVFRPLFVTRQREALQQQRRRASRTKLDSVGVDSSHSSSRVLSYDGRQRYPNRRPRFGRDVAGLEPRSRRCSPVFKPRFGDQDQVSRRRHTRAIPFRPLFATRVLQAERRRLAVRRSRAAGTRTITTEGMRPRVARAIPFQPLFVYLERRAQRNGV